MGSIAKITESDLEAMGVKRGHRVLMLASDRGVGTTGEGQEGKEPGEKE
jgi:hypothetical protein